MSRLVRAVLVVLLALAPSGCSLPDLLEDLSDHQGTNRVPVSYPGDPTR